MKKRDVILLILCIIYSIISIIYIFDSSNAGQIIGMIQFIVIYIPFFILMFAKDKRYAIYISLAFCGFELIVRFLECVKYVFAFITNFQDMINVSIILALVGKILSSLIKIYLIKNIVNYLKEEESKHLNKILIFLGLLFLVVIVYSIINNYVFYEIIDSCKDFVLNSLLIAFIMTNNLKSEVKINSEDN